MKKLLLIILISLSIAPTIKANSIELTRKELVMISEEKFDINIKNKVKGSKYKWTSSNTKVASVNSKNGLVTANRKGKSTVSCVITFPKGNKLKLKTLVKVVDKPELFKNDIIAHAAGGVDGFKYLNSQEGLELSYSNGFKFIEVDLILTADNKVVATHGWDEKTYEHIGVEYDKDNLIMDYDSFMNCKLQGEYSPMDLEHIISFIKKNKDLYLEFDVKATDRESAKLITTQIVELAENDATILDRILMQFISEEAFFGMNEIYNFKYYQYFAFKRHTRSIEKVVKFCKKNNVTSVAVNYNNLTDNVIKQLKQGGILILTHTIDEVELANEFLGKGVDIICTNFISPEKLKVK